MIYTFLADGFEEIEALCPVDIMRRAGLSVTTVGIGKKEIVGAHGITVIADITDSELNMTAPSLSFSRAVCRELKILMQALPFTKHLILQPSKALILPQSALLL